MLQKPHTPPKTRRVNAVQRLLFLPANNKMILLVMLACLLPEARSELVYDCTSSKNTIHSFSMTEVKECPPFRKQYDNGTAQSVQIITKSNKRFIPAKKVSAPVLIIKFPSIIKKALKKGCFSNIGCFLHFLMSTNDSPFSLCSVCLRLIVNRATVEKYIPPITAVSRQNGVGIYRSTVRHVWKS